MGINHIPLRGFSGSTAAKLLAILLSTQLVVINVYAEMSNSEKERSTNILAFIRESKLEESHNFYWAAIAMQSANKNRVANAMDKELVDREMVKFLIKHYNPGVFREGLRWLADPMTVQYLQLLNQPLTGFDAFQRELTKTPLGSKRRTLISRAFAATNAKEGAKQLYMLTIIAAGATEATMALGGLDLYAQLAYRQNEPKVQQDAYDRLAFIFRGVPDEQLELMVFHLEDPVALWALQMMRGALYSGIYITAQKVAQQDRNAPASEVAPARPAGTPSPTDLPTGVKSETVPANGGNLMD